MNIYDYQKPRSFKDLGPRSLRFTVSKFVSTRPIEAKFQMKVCLNGPGHTTNMAAMPIYGKKLFSGTKRPMTVKVGMQHRVLVYYQVCSNDDPGLTLTYFTARSNLAPYAFIWEKGKKVDFSNTLLVNDIKVSRFSQLNEYMNLYECQMSKPFIDLRQRSLRFNIFKLLLLRHR